MNEIEIAERLVKVESRASSNTYRIDNVEKLASAIHEQNVAIAELVAELRFTNKALADHEGRLDHIEKAPLKSAGKIKTAVLSSVASGVIMLIVGALVGLILK